MVNKYLFLYCLYEAESLKVTYTAGRNYNIFNEDSASSGQAAVLESTENGDYLEFFIPSPGAGVYNLTALMKRAPKHGFIQSYINGKTISAPEGEYGTFSYYKNDFGNIAVGSEDLHLRFVAVEKNPVSSNRWIVFDRFDLSSPGGKVEALDEPPKKQNAINNETFTFFNNSFFDAKKFKGKMYEVSFYDLSGKFLKTVIIKNQRISIDSIMSAAKGVYIIKIRNKPYNLL